MRALRLCLAPGGFFRTLLNRFKRSAYMENVLFGTSEKGDLGVLRHAPDNKLLTLTPNTIITIVSS